MNRKTFLLSLGGLLVAPSALKSIEFNEPPQIDYFRFFEIGQIYKLHTEAWIEVHGKTKTELFARLCRKDQNGPEWGICTGIGGTEIIAKIIKNRITFAFTAWGKTNISSQTLKGDIIVAKNRIEFAASIASINYNPATGKYERLRQSAD